MGIFCSTDPFALDAATLDKVNKARRMTTSRFFEKTSAEEHLFRGVYPHIDDMHVFSYLKKLCFVFDDYDVRQLD